MRKLTITSLLILFTGISFSQVKKDTLKTEEISVVKPYTPTISEAFKVKSNPVIDASNSFQKENVIHIPLKGKISEKHIAIKQELLSNPMITGVSNASPL